MTQVELLRGDCLDIMAQMPDSCIDTIITDPPYGLSFMGKKWDYDVPTVKLWQECLRILKPGGTALIFAGPRTQHRMAVNVEDAGFIIKDTIMYLFGSGFPKATDISKQLMKNLGDEGEDTGRVKEHARKGVAIAETRTATGGGSFGEPRTERITAPTTPEAILWDGWKSHGLKPAYEPIIVAMKPNDGSYAENALKWGVAGLNIDGARITINPEKDDKRLGGNGTWKTGNMAKNVYAGGYSGDSVRSSEQGRFPANIIHDGLNGEEWSRYFYTAKASKSERNAGCERIITWESVDLNLQMGSMPSLVKDMSEDIIHLLNGKECCTMLFGKIVLDQFQQGLMSTIKMATKLIMELKTLNCNQSSIIRGYILDAIRMMQADGLSLAASVESLSLLIPSITSERMASALGVIVAVLQTLQQISVLGRQGNVHSTVKPLALMEYLCKLTKTPTGGVVLDPFAGSGTTGVACRNTGRDCILIEREAEYWPVIEARIRG